MIIIPDEIIEKLKMFCIENNLGMSAVGNENYFILILGNREMSPNQVHLMCAMSMIDGVLSGQWEDANTIAEQQEKEERKPM